MADLTVAALHQLFDSVRHMAPTSGGSNRFNCTHAQKWVQSVLHIPKNYIQHQFQTLS